MELKTKTPEQIIFIANMDVSLANAIRRSVNEIPIIAIEEVDFYKNDSVLYDEILAHRMGLLPLKNQKLKNNQKIELKLKVKGKKEGTEVLVGEIGEEVVYPDMPLVLLGEGQVIELVARAGLGRGIDHARYSPGVLFYKHLPKIKISGEGTKQTSLAEIYPETFELDSSKKLKVKDATKGDIDQEDIKNYNGVTIEFDDDLVFSVESWGQLEAKEIFTEACKILKENLSEVSKIIK